MNKLDIDYQLLLQDILDNGVKKTDRTGTGTISVFGRQIRHNMKDGFPLLTTKKMAFKTMVTELLWFLRGDTNIKYLVDNDCNIWNGDAYKNYLKLTTDTEPLSQEEFINKIKQNEWGFAKTWGDLGPVYGKQWRRWDKIEDDGMQYGISEIDQIQNSINLLKTDPDSRRNRVNAWNVGELDQMVLPPCHTDFQFFTRELSFAERVVWMKNNTSTQQITLPQYIDDKFSLDEYFKPYGAPTRAISLMWNQRSVDAFLGLPFNIASYGLLLKIIAKEVNMVPDELIGNLGDVHLYSNHIEQAKEQIGRELTYEERYSIHKDYITDDKLDLLFEFATNDNLNKLGVPKRTREPYPLPKLNFSWYIENWSTEEAKKIRKDSFDAYIRQMKPSDFVIENYQSHPAIKAPLSN
jgi:thymidylate synthase